MVYWRREWQTTSEVLTWEPHEQYEKGIKMPFTLEAELPRSVGALFATGEEWRNNSKRNERVEPKQKQCPVMDVSDGESKARFCKEQYWIRT